MKIDSQIIFLYYEHPEDGYHFYSDILGLKLITDQGFARIYQAGAAAFVGVVDGNGGFFRPQPKNAVMITFAVDDVPAWAQHLHAQGVEFVSEPGYDQALNIESFFFKDPAGYVLEIQKFFDLDLMKTFHPQ